MANLQLGLPLRSRAISALRAGESGRGALTDGAGPRSATRRCLASLIPLLVLALPPAGVAYQRRVVVAVEEGRCTLTLEADDDGRALRIRVAPEDARCEISREAVQQLLRDGFSKTDPPRLEGVYSSLYIGRLVDFPWLSSYVASAAAADARWDRRRGKPVAGGPNRYVGMLLSSAEVTGPLEAALQGTGYRIGAATVEKVLVGGFRDVPGHEGPTSRAKVPFDAMVWFRLEKSERRRGVGRRAAQRRERER